MLFKLLNIKQTLKIDSLAVSTHSTDEDGNASLCLVDGPMRTEDLALLKHSKRPSNLTINEPKILKRT
jgi:hypothetical protein